MKKQIQIALFIISLNVLFLSETDAEMPGMDGNIHRAYAETEFGGDFETTADYKDSFVTCLLYTSPSPRDRQKSRMPSSA